MPVLLYITFFAGFLPLAALVLLKSKIPNTMPAKPFIYLAAASSLYEMIFTVMLKIDSRVWFTVYDILAFLCIFYYFFKINRPKYSSIFTVSMVIFALVAGAGCFIAPRSLSHFLHVQAVFSGTITLFVMVMTFLWFTDIFRKMEVPNLWDLPDFYNIAGLFIYYSTTFFLFLLSDIIQTDGSVIFLNYWMLNVVAALILRTLLTIGVWKSIRN